MTVVCDHCGHGSSVVETRTVLVRGSGVSTAARRRTRTVCRLRQCKRCRFRWKTMEVPVRRHSRTWSKVAKEPVSRRTRQ